MGPEVCAVTSPMATNRGWRIGARRATRIVAATVLGLVGAVAAVTVGARPAAAYPLGAGYWLVGAKGAVYAEGQAQNYGSKASPSGSIVGMAAFPFLEGYWLASSSGAVYPFGSSGYYGQALGKKLVKPIVGIAATPPGLGYWLVGGDGTIFSFGDAKTHGSLAGKKLAAPIAGIASTPDGGGYWLVASNGDVYSFGDAKTHGTLLGKKLVKPIVGMTATPDGGGYWLVGSNGAVYNFGDAGAYGSEAGARLAAPVVAIARTADGHGYWLAGSNGAVYNFGDAGPYGSQAGKHLAAPVVGIAGRPPLAVKVDAYVGSSSQSSNWVHTAGGWQLQLTKARTGTIPAGALVLGVDGIEVSQLQTLGFTLASGTCTSNALYFLLYVHAPGSSTPIERAYQCSEGGVAAAKTFNPVAGVPGAPALPATDVVTSLDIDELTAGDSAALTNVRVAGLTITSYLTFYSYVLAPTVAKVGPNKGPAGGGTVVTVTGTNFGGATAVHFGSLAARIVKVLSADAIEVVSPRGSGTVDVTVTTSVTTSSRTPADRFSYIPTPAVKSIAPRSGPAAGGTLVTISGADFTGATAVHFGTAAGRIHKLVSASEIEVISPKGTGTVNVTISTPGGTSPGVTGDRFTYAAAPAVKSIAPRSGPAAGGTHVTVSGSNFSGATAVHFGSAAAHIVKVVSADEIEVISPKGTGTVDVTVTTAGGTSAKTSADRFAY